MNSDMVMQMSPSVASIAKALILAQGNMETVRKQSDNPFFKAKYADLGNVLEAVQPALQSQGIAIVQAAGGDGDKVSVETMLLHESGEYLRSVLTLTPVKGDPQAAGSAITYARRYALLAMCGVAPEDDDGNTASGKAPKDKSATRPAPARNAAPPQSLDLRRLIREVYYALEIDPNSKDEAAHTDAILTVAQSLNKMPVPTRWSEFVPDELSAFLKAQSTQAAEQIVNRWKMTAAQQKHLFALEGELKIKDPQERYDGYSKIAKRAIGSANDLTESEFNAVVKMYGTMLDVSNAVEEQLG